MFLISLVHHHHPALLRRHALILDRLLTFLVAFSTVVSKPPFLKVFPFIAIYPFLGLISWNCFISHRRHGQDKTVFILSVSAVWTELSTRQDSFVLSRTSFQFATVQPQISIEDYWKLSWLVASSVHTTDTHKIWQSCLVRDGDSVVWNRQQ